MSKNQIKKLIELFEQANLKRHELAKYVNIDALSEITDQLEEMIKILNPVLYDWITWYVYEHHISKTITSKEPVIIDGEIKVYNYKQFIDYLAEKV